MLKQPGLQLAPLFVALEVKAGLAVVDIYTQVEACISEPGGRVFMCPCVFTEEARLCLESVFAHYEASSSIMFQPGKWA